MPTRIKGQGETFDISGEVGLDYRSFRQPQIRKALLFTVDPHLTMRFHLVGTLRPTV